MKTYSMETRVNRLKQHIQEHANRGKFRFSLEPVADQSIKRLRNLENFPLDMLMILEQMGCMRDWGARGSATGEMCHVIDWWIPCTIECARAQDRCSYDLLDSNFTNPSDLLFFAWDCDAKCYFYDISLTPWKIKVCDGLGLSFHNEASRVISDWDGKVTPWESDGDDDALSVIERWAFMPAWCG